MCINRKLWRGYCNSENISELQHKIHIHSDHVIKLIKNGKILGLSLFSYKKHLFLYYESLKKDLIPNDILKGINSNLENWPGYGDYREWVELYDIFHFNTPVSIKHWKRKTPVKKHVGKIGRLKPEYISKYLFYHYALQEEQAFPGDKYEIIGLNENYIFGYFEEPTVIEAPIEKPKIDINVVPENWADAGISDCFSPWNENSDERFKPMNEVFSIWEV